LWSLDDLRAVDAVVREGSFAAASRRLGVTRSAVSKAVRRIEEELEVQLFVRNTHEVRPTDIGREFHARAMAALNAAEDATAMVRDRHAKIAGVVRVSMPTSLGFLFLDGELARLLAKHPGLAVDVSITDRMVDLVGEGFDVVLRIAATKPLVDSDLISRKLVSGRLRLCASPGWLAANPAPLAVADLSQAPCLLFSQDFEPGRVAAWPVAEGSATSRVPVSGPLRTNSAMALRAAAEAGAGIALLAGFLVSQPLADGRLVELLPGARTASYSIYALRPPSAYPSRAVMTLIDTLQAWLVGLES